METGDPLGAIHDVSRRKLLFGLAVVERRRAADDEEHLLGAVVHVQRETGRPGQELV
jgi:hypothetical protein